MICTYLPSVRKRGRNGHRMSMMPAYVASGPYDRPMQTQSQAQIQSLSSLAAHHSMLSSNSSTSTGAAPRHQQGQFQPQQTVYNMSGLIPQQSLSQYQQQQQQQQQHSLQHQFLPPPPPPPPAASQPQINPLGSNFMSGGPVSLHLKRDPGFGQNPMEEAMYDQSKQAQEMSSHFLLPVNSLHYSAFTPNYGSQFGSHAGSSNQHGRYGITSGSSSKRNDGSSSQMGLSGANTSYTHRTPSGSNTGQQRLADLYSNGALSSTAAKIKASQPATIPSNFDPAALAQNLSSAYVSVVANMPTSHGSHQDVSTAAAPPAKSANARGKSSSHTPLGMFSEDNDVSPATAAKMRELRKKILSIISSVWADTECGRSAGMAGVTVADEDIGVEHGLGSSNGNDNNSSCDPLKDCSPNISPSGCQSTADVALCQGIKSMATMVSPSGDRSMDDHLINIFFDYVHQQLPIINRTEFTKSYQQGKVSMLLICAMCSAASVFLNRIEDERKSIYELYSQKVREMFHDACFEPSLEVVQTALIMTLCEYRHACEY
ncbi:hypothetical protein LPJ64_002699 [Coemansia asiatica]|uniref:Xylanolytic transcriptional activator regulatory domain-containing protein n=1 Tax=Coemansia asiatica TaxID=1052880 RepID=A0A9W8CJG5_9FUNG|nr:hypothetical protein LPJ64_002699 [Coemansia asiatica]